MAIDLPPRIQTIVELVGEYFKLEDNELIERHNELLRMADIKDGKYGDNHPHHGLRAYIRRRALKHVVEERRAELSKDHTAEEVLAKITAAVEQVPEIIVNFDKYEYQLEPDKTEKSEKYFFAKHYQGEPSIRVLCERTKAGLEICSIHFTKQKKDE